MIIAIIQARVGSTRLPGKVLLDLHGKPVLWHVIKRVSHSKKINKVIVATTTLKEDNPIEELCHKEGISFYRGSSDDVLNRYYNAAQNIHSKGEHLDFVVRITADCPFIDPEIIDTVIETMVTNNYDYISNALQPTYPDGLDVEIFTFNALIEANNNARLPSEREHVTPYIIKNNSFRKYNFPNQKDLSHMRWTLDEPEDYQFIQKVYNYLYDEKSLFHMQDILNLLSKYPELETINKKYQRNEGYEKSLEHDVLINESRL